MVCSECFYNEGLRIEAERIGHENSQTCSCCKSPSGKKLNEDNLRDLMSKFFVHGSVPQNIGGYAPVYSMSDNSEMESVHFKDSLNHDYELIREQLSTVLFHYAPALWRLGYTNTYFELDEAGENYDLALPALSMILDRCQLAMLPIHTKLYRIRIGIQDDYQSPASYDTVPEDIRKKIDGGRFDSMDVPILYTSPDIETCLHECRVTVADEISLATLSTNKELRLLNIADSFKELDSYDPFGDVGITMNKLCTTNKDEYSKCRLIGQAIKQAGYDGFKFKSYYSLVKDQPLYNIAIFGYPIQEGTMNVQSVNRIKLEKVSYDFSFGPVPEDSSDIEEIPEV